MDKLRGKVALISGAASGIGAATARKFVGEGAKVVIGDLDADRGSAVARELGDSALFVPLDVAKPHDWAAAIDAAIGRFGAVTTVVNCAGISPEADIEQETLERFQRVIAINLEGTFLGCQAAVRAMKGGVGGAIVNVASTQGVRPLSSFPAYAASKGGVRLLTRTVALHCAEKAYDIRCNAILPGAIQTPMVDDVIRDAVAHGADGEAVLAAFVSAHPMKRVGRPHEPADAIVFLASDDASFITGIDLPVDGGLLA